MTTPQQTSPHTDTSPLVRAAVNPRTLTVLRAATIAFLNALDDALGYERTIPCRQERRKDRSALLTNDV